MHLTLTYRESDDPFAAEIAELYSIQGLEVLEYYDGCAEVLWSADHFMLEAILPQWDVSAPAWF